jgi:hypothetical protein
MSSTLFLPVELPGIAPARSDRLWLAQGHRPVPTDSSTADAQRPDPVVVRCGEQEMTALRCASEQQNGELTKKHLLAYWPGSSTIRGENRWSA